jgi:hypothetical protein
MTADVVALRLYDILELVKNIKEAKVTTQDGLAVIEKEINALARDVLKEDVYAAAV